MVKKITTPERPKIYHIVHVDRLSSIIADQHLWCDAEVIRRSPQGTPIGMSKIKQRRLNKLSLASHPALHVGDCVPFYFCPRSVMLHVISCRNHPELSYTGGQEPIVHLEADLHTVVKWSNQNEGHRWAFTLSNAGACYFEDRNDLGQLDQIDWQAVQADRWKGDGIPASTKEGKQAEFLIEQSFSWHLVERIGVHSQTIFQQVMSVLPSSDHHRPRVEITPAWYY